METIKKEEVESPNTFPCLDNNEHSGQIKIHSEGMTLRDYFAAKAMQGELSSQDYVNIQWANEKELAERAYLVADAMLKQRQAIEKAL